MFFGVICHASEKATTTVSIAIMCLENMRTEQREHSKFVHFTYYFCDGYIKMGAICIMNKENLTFIENTDTDSKTTFGRSIEKEKILKYIFGTKVMRL